MIESKRTEEIEVRQDAEYIIVGDAVVFECENEEHANVVFPRMEKMVRKHVVSLILPDDVSTHLEQKETAHPSGQPSGSSSSKGTGPGPTDKATGGGLTQEPPEDTEEKVDEEDDQKAKE